MAQTTSISSLLGPLPCIQGFLRWGLAVLASLGAWHLHQWAPMPGLVAIGLAPFVNMYLFFRGLSYMSRTIPYCKTRFRAHRLGLVPTWGCAEGGYLLVDEIAGVWIADGVSGRLADLSALACRTDGQAFRLELYTDPEATPPLYRKPRGMIPVSTPNTKQDIPLASVGMHSFDNLQEAGRKLCDAVATNSKKNVSLTIRDERDDEDRQASQADRNEKKTSSRKQNDR